MRFEWDAFKALRNRLKHGIPFSEAVTAFDDEFHWITDDIRHSAPAEKRLQLIGRMLPGGRVVTIIFTIRGPDLIHRLISARPASRLERRIYEQAYRP